MFVTKDLTSPPVTVMLIRTMDPSKLAKMQEKLKSKNNRKKTKKEIDKRYNEFMLVYGDVEKQQHLEWQIAIFESAARIAQSTIESCLDKKTGLVRTDEAELGNIGVDSEGRLTTLGRLKDGFFKEKYLRATQELINYNAALARLQARLREFKMYGEQAFNELWDLKARVEKAVKENDKEEMRVLPYNLVNATRERERERKRKLEEYDKEVIRGLESYYDTQG